MIKQLSGLFLLILISITGVLADMQGTDKDGNPVILRSDGTWSYVGNTPEECKAYARSGVSQQRTNEAWQCGYTDVMWHAGYERHYNWCVGAGKDAYKSQMESRASALLACSTVTKAAPEYLGCFIDKEERDVVGSLTRTKTMTTEACVSECRQTGYKIASTQYGEQCFCGNDYGSYGRTSDVECSFPCAGNYDQKCGGGWRNSVYRVRP